MYQLLNSGMGYGYMSPMPTDPNDNRTDEERFNAGCGTIIAYVICILLVLLFCGVFGSCTTHRNVCDITTAESDSITQYIEQTASVAKHDTSASRTASVFNSSAVESTEAEEIETETITEQITETIDSLGRTTTTTNRTTTRQRKATTNTQSLLDQYKEEIALQMHLYGLAAKYDSLMHITQIHRSDSAAHHEEKQSDSVYYNIIKEWIDGAFRAVLVIIIVVIVYLTVKYWRNK